MVVAAPGPAADPSAAPAEWVDDLSPIGASDWSYDRAAHLLERAGFSGTPEEIERLASMTPQQAVDYLVDYESIEADSTPFEPSLAWDEGMYADADRHLEFFEGIRRGYEVGERWAPFFGQLSGQVKVDSRFMFLGRFRLC